jgi:hypothetical protein
MDKTPTPMRKRQSVKPQQRPRTGKTEALIIGLVLVIVGSLVASSFEKGTLTNYAGFGMLLFGIASLSTGTCSLVSSGVKNRLLSENPEYCKGKSRLPLCTSILVTGAGVTMGVLW